MVEIKLQLTAGFVQVRLGVIQNYVLLFSSVIGTGLRTQLRASDTGPIS